ncbi:hypothetical protein ACRAWF_42195 [Streptomyces sp. L7]
MTLAVLFFMFVVPAVIFYYHARSAAPSDFNPRQAAKRLHLFEHGMIADQETGVGTVAVRWDRIRLYEEQVQKIINGIPGPILYTCVATSPGASVTVTNFYENPRTWAPAMQRRYCWPSAPPRSRAFLAGRGPGLRRVSASPPPASRTASSCCPGPRSDRSSSAAAPSR